LTPVSGVVAVAELVGRLGVTVVLDDAVGSIKLRDRVQMAAASFAESSLWEPRAFFLVTGPLCPANR
jgi:hypothetical protein